MRRGRSLESIGHKCHGGVIAASQSVLRCGGVSFDTDYVLTRLLQVFYPDDAAQWLVTPEPLLNGARAVDVLALRGPASVVRALDGIVQGVFA